MPKHHTPTGFQNYPFVETAAPKGMFFYLHRFWNSVFIPDVPPQHALATDESLRQLNGHDNPSITWLGHATFLIRVGGVNILTDPFLTEFASPISWAGPRRFVEPGIPLDGLPRIDIVIVSHNHYDHLDEKTISQLKNKENIRVIVPLGVGQIFSDNGFVNINELDWGDSVSVGNVQITSHPAVHDSARSTSDHNKTLWASWSIVGKEERIFFIGDSGYSNTIYKKIGEQFGGFDYAIIPIGAYAPRELMWMSHVNPEEAVTIGLELGANTLIASHWGTVSSLSDEPMWEPPKRFLAKGLDSGLSEEALWIMKVGETRSLN